MKKLFASLIVAAMLFIPFGMAMAEDAPLTHRMRWMLGDTQHSDIIEWILDNGQFDLFKAIFTGVFNFEAVTPESNTISFIYFAMTGESFLSFEDQDGIIYYEKTEDGDFEVDAVARHYKDTNEFNVYYYVEDDVPSIYSSIFQKHLYKLWFNHIYDPYQSPREQYGN